MLNSHPNRHDQVVEAPRYDDVVVASDDDGDDRGPEADAAQVGVDVVPHDVAALAELLSDAQLEEEERHPLQDHHDQEWDHKGTWEMLYMDFVEMLVNSDAKFSSYFL